MSTREILHFFLRVLRNHTLALLAHTSLHAITFSVTAKRYTDEMAQNEYQNIV